LFVEGSFCSSLQLMHLMIYRMKHIEMQIENDIIMNFITSELPEESRHCP
jgi:hypothetical protein